MIAAGTKTTCTTRRSRPGHDREHTEGLKAPEERLTGYATVDAMA